MNIYEIVVNAHGHIVFEEESDLSPEAITAKYGDAWYDGELDLTGLELLLDSVEAKVIGETEED